MKSDTGIKLSRSDYPLVGLKIWFLSQIWYKTGNFRFKPEVRRWIWNLILALNSPWSITPNSTSKHDLLSRQSRKTDNFRFFCYIIGHMGFRPTGLFLAEVSGRDASNELSSVKFGSLGVSEVHLHSIKKHVLGFIISFSDRFLWRLKYRINYGLSLKVRRSLFNKQSKP